MLISSLFRRTGAVAVGGSLLTACWAIAGIEDRPVRVVVVEAGGGDDSGEDAPSANDASDAGGDQAGRRLCATHAGAAVCDDFDDPTLRIPNYWTRHEAANGKVALIDSVQSPPQAVGFTGAGNGDAARLEHTIGSFRTLTCTFAVYYDLVTPGGFEIAHLDVQGNGTGQVLTLTNDGIKVPGDSRAVTAPAAGSWVHYKLVLDFAQTAPIATLTRPDDASVQAAVSLSAFPPPQTTVLSLGLQFGPGGPMQFRFDDVLCEI